jgi:hypothetical protein
MPPPYPGADGTDVGDRVASPVAQDLQKAENLQHPAGEAPGAHGFERHPERLGPVAGGQQDTDPGGVQPSPPRC